MSDKIPIALVRKYLADQCSPEEINQVNDWFSSYQHYPDSLTELPPHIRKEIEKELFARITKQISDPAGFPTAEDNGEHGPKSNSPWQGRILLIRTIRIAAMIVAVVGLSFYLFSRKQQIYPVQRVTRVNRFKDLPPGGNHATLTLGNGKTIVLDSTANGIIAQQGNSSIQKKGNGQLIYTADNLSQAAGLQDLPTTVSTPLGGQYRVILPDGTQAWLNSSSSLTFPAHFAGNERRVEMTGEVYFEVAKNPHMPFKVKSKQSEVEVLGTHFNMMTYDDEREQKTTLLEGAVRISAGKIVNTLVPGEQAVITSAGAMSLRKGVDLDNTVAWKDGFFDFKNQQLSAIMRQAARWYGISVTYKGGTAAMAFTGRIPREVNLSVLLKLLQYTGLKCQLEGKNVTFEP